MIINSNLVSKLLILGLFAFVYIRYYTFKNTLKNLFKYGYWDDIATDDYIVELSQRINMKMANIDGFREDNNCPLLFNGSSSGSLYKEALNKSYYWEYKFREEEIMDRIESANDTCKELKDQFVFLDKPLSKEEAEYPVAYGIIVHSNIEQILYELSLFYQPQNAYCIAVDGNSDRKFVRRIQILQQCFPNIHVFQVPPIKYCGYEILKTLWDTVVKLTLSNHPWRYFQYISGVDLPLKTNREMVRIFKALNGSFNVDVMTIEPYRIPNGPSLPFKIWKSSMSSLFSRETAISMVRNPVIQNYVRYLRTGSCQDESLWGTVAGQPDVFNLPGGFNATELILKIQNDVFEMEKRQKMPRKKSVLPFPLNSFYISRYQVWDRINFVNAGNYCKGKFVSMSCVFGPNALPDLLIRSELVVHKLYLNTFPSTFFCLYERIWNRALNRLNQETFDASSYNKLALFKE